MLLLLPLLLSATQQANEVSGERDGRIDRRRAQVSAECVTQRTTERRPLCWPSAQNVIHLRQLSPFASRISRLRPVDSKFKLHINSQLVCLTRSLAEQPQKQRCQQPPQSSIRKQWTMRGELTVGWHRAASETHSLSFARRQNSFHSARRCCSGCSRGSGARRSEGDNEGEKTKTKKKTKVF